MNIGKVKLRFLFKNGLTLKSILWFFEVFYFQCNWEVLSKSDFHLEQYVGVLWTLLWLCGNH